jgi:ABC-2 type transport system permease protein
MSTDVRRYLGLFGVQLRASLLLSMQYRLDFVLEAVVEIFWSASAVIPLLVVFGGRASAFGWQLGDALLVTAFFLLLQGVIEGAINPSLNTVVEHVRKGTLDFVLLKPADALFLVCTARFAPWRAVNLLSASVIVAIALGRLHYVPGPAQIAICLLLLCASIVILYSLWILTVSAAFYVVRVDNLTFLFGALFDAARWPARVFRGVFRFIFTFVVPFGVMTSFPAEALLGRLAARDIAAALGLALFFALVARRVWLRAIAQYTSAGG